MMNKLSGYTFSLVTNICTLVIIRPQMKLFTEKRSLSAAFTPRSSKTHEDT